MNSLQRLISQRMRERHWTYEQVAQRGGPPRSTLHHLATMVKLSRPPQPATLERLARGLDLPLETVRMAAAEAAGISLWREPVAGAEVDVIAASLTRLSPTELAHVRALVESLLNGR